jgi:hypothetical protein
MHLAPVAVPAIDVGMLFGFLAVLATLVCYLERNRSSKARLALCVCLLLTAAYGFSRGTWPLGMLQITWAGVAFARWWSTEPRAFDKKTAINGVLRHRNTQLFGSTYCDN